MEYVQKSWHVNTKHTKWNMCRMWLSKRTYTSIMVFSMGMHIITGINVQNVEEPVHGKIRHTYVNGVCSKCSW